MTGVTGGAMDPMDPMACSQVTNGSSVVMLGTKLDTRWIKLPYGYLTLPCIDGPFIVGLPIKNGDFPVM